MAGLKEILEARENRSRRIEILRRVHGLPVILLSLNIPGPDKLISRWAEVMEAGRHSLLDVLSMENIPLRFQAFRTGAAGPEWYASASADTARLKRLCVGVEQEHTLGRIFDLDVHPVTGGQVSRAALGLPARCCLVCERPAHECGRSGRHGNSELLNSIETTLFTYFFNI